jgi:serine/threonine-protein kinase
MIIIIAVLMLSIALPSTTTNIIIYRQQQEALAQSNDDDNNNTFKLYENVTYGIKIEYPSNWTIEEEGDEDSDNVTDVVSFFAPVRNDSETVTPSLYITIDNPPLNLIENLNEYLRTTINDYNDDSQDFQVIESNTNSSTLGGYPAYKLVYTDVDGDNINYKDMEIGTIIGDKVYLVTYDAAEEEYSVYLPAVQKMIDSLKITTSNN